MASESARDDDTGDDTDDGASDDTAAGARCGTCGHVDDEGANYCSNCGAALVASRDSSSGHDTTAMFAVDDLATEEATERATRGDGLPVLAVVQGPNAGTRLTVMSDRVTIGRHPDSDLFLDDITVSRRHAEVLREGDRYRIVDVGSLNGIYLNEAQVDRAELADGDEVRVGRYLIRFLHG